MYLESFHFDGPWFSLDASYLHVLQIQKSNTSIFVDIDGFAVLILWVAHHSGNHQKRGLGSGVVPGRVAWAVI